MKILLGLFIFLFAIFQIGGIAIGAYLLWEGYKNLSSNSKAQWKGRFQGFFALLWRHKIITIVALLAMSFLAPEIGFGLYMAFMVMAAASWGIFFFLKAAPHLKNAAASLHKKAPQKSFKMPTWQAKQQQSVAPVQPTPASMMTPAVNPPSSKPNTVCNIVN